MPLFQENRPDFTNRRATAREGFSAKRRTVKTFPSPPAKGSPRSMYP
jgi:hypothetical protein